MSERIDVLAVLDAEVDTIHRLQEWVNEALAPTKLTAEEAIERLVEARAAVAELVEALQRIESFRCELAGISEADALEMQECAECARCRAKRWPPSHLCTAHYAVISRRDRLNESRESTQHIDMREIARTALARIAPNELHDKAAELRGRGE